MSPMNSKTQSQLGHKLIRVKQISNRSKVFTVLCNVVVTTREPLLFYGLRYIISSFDYLLDRTLNPDYVPV